MSHYTEHILELYVQNSTEVQERRAEIEQHLAECYSCRELVQEMRDFYTQAEDSKKLLSGQSDESTSLVMEAHIRKRHIVPAYISDSLPARIVRFVKKRPVTSSLFTMGFLALCFISINTIQKKIEVNPWHYNYNVNNNSVEIFGENDEKLWEKRLSEIVESLSDWEKTYSIHKTLVADVNNDGQNEVIILPNFAADDKTSPKPKVFDGKGNLIETYTLSFQRIQYKSKLYETEFMARGVVFGGNKQKNVFVAYNNGRSPAIIVRYDEQGNILGTYWHYGQIVSMTFFDVDRDRRDELILSGINDTEDETKRSFATTIIVDPDKVVGNSECSATKGFGFPSSDAELYYIQYPNPEIVTLSPANLMATNSIETGDKFLRVLNKSYSEQLSVAMEYFLESTLTVNEVKFDAQTLNYHNQLFKEEKLKQPINDEYIKSLKDAVQYWNGTNWVNKPTRIGINITLK